MHLNMTGAKMLSEKSWSANLLDCKQLVSSLVYGSSLQVSLCLHMVFCYFEWVSTLICTNMLELNMVWMVQGDKNIIKFEGDHNSPRPQFYYDSITIFFYNVLQPSEAPLAVEAPEPIYFDDALDIDDVDEVCVSGLRLFTCFLFCQWNSCLLKVQWRGCFFMACFTLALSFIRQ